MGDDEVQPVRPDVRVALDFIATSDEAAEEQTPVGARAALQASAALADLPIGDIAVNQDLAIPSPNGPIPAALLDSRVRIGVTPVVMWFHGGGYVTGDVDTYRSIGAEVARQLDLPVLIVGYRLAPESPFPAAHDDAEAACRWVASNPPGLGVDVVGLVLAGDSAGGTLALSTSVALRNEPAQVPVLAQLAICPGTDESASYPSEQTYASSYILPDTSRRWFRQQSRLVATDWRASPILADLRGSPPSVVMTAECDPVRDEGRAFAAKLVTSGVITTFLEAPGSVHAFVLLRQVAPSCQDDLRTALAALRTLVTELPMSPDTLES
jgi:acetyl esterase